MSVNDRLNVLGWTEANALERANSVLCVKGTKPDILQELVNCGTLVTDEKADFMDVLSAVMIVDKFASCAERTRTTNAVSNRNDSEDSFPDFQKFMTVTLESIQSLTASRELYKKS